MKKKIKVLPSLKKLILGRSLEEKYAQAIGIIQTNLQEFPLNRQIATLSGGKDSTLLLFMIRNECQMLGIDPNEIAVLFENTGVEYQETIQFISHIRQEWGITNFIETKPEKTFWQCVKEYGYPRPKSNRQPRGGKKNKRPLCCDYLKERPGKKVMANYDVVYLGTTAVESRQRQMRAVSHGTCYFAKADNIKKVLPLLYFTEAEIWELHQKLGVPHNKVYDYGLDRCGCWPCTAFRLWRENMQMYEQARPDTHMYRKIMHDLGQKVLTEENLER